MDLKLTGQRAAVTGASKGIGASVAKALAAEGCELILAARSAALLDGLAKDLKTDYGVAATALDVDLTTLQGRERFAAEAGPLDILVNNAGAIPSGDLLALDSQTWRDGWELKVLGYIDLSREIYRAMKARGGGVIVNIIGLAGAKPDAGYIAGSAGNAALIQFTQALGGRSPKDGIRVVGINPSLTATDRAVAMIDHKAATNASVPDFKEKFLANLPFGRMAKPDEIADLTAFLASPRAGYISGAVFDVDGGIRWAS